MKKLSIEKIETLEGGVNGQDTMHCVSGAYSNL